MPARGGAAAGGGLDGEAAGALDVLVVVLGEALADDVYDDLVQVVVGNDRVALGAPPGAPRIPPARRPLGRGWLHRDPWRAAAH